MNLKNCIAGLAFLTSLPAFGQSGLTKLTHPSSPSDTSAKTDKLIGDGFIGMGFVLGNSMVGDKIVYGQSREFIVGIGVGYKLATWNGFGIDLYYKNTNYFLVQDSTKILPTNALYNSEKITLDNFGGLVFDRFYIGSVFVDAGFYFDWTFYTKHESWENYTNANINGGGSTISIDRQLIYLNSYNYGLTFRFGKSNGPSLYFNYRLTNVFEKNFTQFYNLPLPPYVLGIVLAIH
jgi:hypothetical protein